VSRLTEEQLAAWKRLQWANALIMARFRSDLADTGLTVEEFDVLIHLARVAPGALSLQELTASMVVAGGMSRSGITRLLDRMERDGLLRRTLSPHDRRRFDVALTPRGRKRFDQIWPGHAEGIARYFVAPLTSRDIRELDRITDLLIHANEDEPH
jgi:DNA-binding MarR family transcriptional regulator